MRVIICVLVALAIYTTQRVLLADTPTSLRYDVQFAQDSRAANYKSAANMLTPPFLARLKAADNKWATSEVTKHINYIMRTYPFYDSTRAEAIAILHQSTLLNNLASSSADNVEKALKNIEDNKIFDFYIVQWARVLEEHAIKHFEKDVGLVNENFLYCSYDNYDTARAVLSELADVLLQYDGASKTGSVLGLGAAIDRETMDCKFRGNVKSFSTSYFYTSSFTGTKFFTRDPTKQISNTEIAQGINVTSNTVKSSLDFFVIRLDIEIDKQKHQDIYAFQADKGAKKLSRIDSDYFLNSIATQYTFDK